jgi:C4-dicarboxylate-specific signal transduction histidine kinase
MSIPGFVEQFLPLVREDFTKKGIDLDLQLDPGAERIFADPRALQQVLLNILTNASDAVSEKEHPKIELRIFKSGRMIHIETEDNGSGIPEEKMKDLFKPFYTTKTKGTGLGLVIVKKMLTKMKGTIEVKSRRDVGTLVTITLPEGMHEQR